MSASEHRSGLVALAGRPNAGKSTLVNRLVGEHVAAVSRRPQTTRRRALGAVAGDGWQLVLVDLPGFQKPFDRLTERMQRSVDETLADADAVVLMLNGPEGVGPGDRHIAARAMREGAVPCLIAINKVDRMRPGAIAEVIVAADALGECHAIHPISALTGDGVEPLLADLVELLEQGPAYFPPGVTSDQTSEVRIGEAIREAALEATRDEVPHAVAVLVEEVAPARRGPIVVRAVLICETESQKGILVGKGGSMVKHIGSTARPLIETITGGPTYLELTVKVRPRWRRDDAALDRMGI
ncbi:MAG: GTPase [Gaiellales bacterium]|nr:GTPase [Gaiellales bacterium]